MSRKKSAKSKGGSAGPSSALPVALPHPKGGRAKGAPVANGGPPPLAPAQPPSLVSWPSLSASGKFYDIAFKGVDDSGKRMSRVPLGKVLLRNVIRHTDAHNKIHEESEMWKIREMEKQSEDAQWGKKRKLLPNSSCSRMRSDGFDEETAWKVRDLASMSVETDDLRHARYWNKKLYEYESNMPDRWGHSGYKELYPEEFDTDSDQEREEQQSVNGKRRSQPGKLSTLELPKRKKPKKSHKKKQKKKSHKKWKKKKREQPSAAAESSQVESESSEGNVGKRKRKQHRKAKKASSSEHESSSSTASSSTSGPEGKPERQTKKKRRKRYSPASERGSDKEQGKRSKRKNWKVAADENSEDTSDED